MPSTKAGQPVAAVRLEAVNRQLRRWQTRATRANNMVAKLLKTQRRIMVEFDYGPVVRAALNKPWSEAAPPPALPKAVAAPPTTLASPATVEVVPPSVEKKKEIPSFLDRSDPLIAEKMTAARKKAEADERKKMPVTGREAERLLRREIGKAKARKAIADKVSA